MKQLLQGHSSWNHEENLPSLSQSKHLQQLGMKKATYLSYTIRTADHKIVKSNFKSDDNETLQLQFSFLGRIFIFYNQVKVGFLINKREGTFQKSSVQVISTMLTPMSY